MLDAGLFVAFLGGAGEGEPARPETRRLTVGTVERCAMGSDGGERRFGVTLDGGKVYTIEVHTAPRGVRCSVGLYGPSGDLLGCDGGWGRVRLAHAAAATGLYSLAAEVGSGGLAIVMRVQPWTSEELARAGEDPFFVL